MAAWEVIAAWWQLLFHSAATWHLLPKYEGQRWTSIMSLIHNRCPYSSTGLAGFSKLWGIFAIKPPRVFNKNNNNTAYIEINAVFDARCKRTSLGEPSFRNPALPITSITLSSRKWRELEGNGTLENPDITIQPWFMWLICFLGDDRG